MIVNVPRHRVIAGPSDDRSRNFLSALLGPEPDLVPLAVGAVVALRAYPKTPAAFNVMYANEK